MGRQIKRHGFGQAFKGVLGGTVNCAVDRAHMPHLRRHVDDAALEATLDHLRSDSLRDKEGSPHVNVEDGVVVLFGHGGEWFRNISTSVVHQDMNVGQARDHLGNLIGLGHIADHRAGLAAPRNNRGHSLV